MQAYRQHQNTIEKGRKIVRETRYISLGGNEQSVEILDKIELPGWVYEVLSMGPNHPIRDKFNETLFFD